MARSSEGPVELGSLVADLLDDTGLRAQVVRIGVLDSWASLVGPGIARGTRASGVTGEKLFVEVVSSPWLMELSGMKRQLLELVNKSVPEYPFTDIVFLIAAHGEPRHRPSASTSPPRRGTTRSRKRP